jgi:hypothetical protein
VNFVIQNNLLQLDGGFIHTFAQTPISSLVRVLLNWAHAISGRINVFDSLLMDVEHKDMLGILPPGCVFK